jgi:predicted component of type VI protein secretion system
MIAITTPVVERYKKDRIAQGIVNRKGERVGDISNATLERELQILKRIKSVKVELMNTWNRSSRRTVMLPQQMTRVAKQLQRTADRSFWLEAPPGFEPGMEVLQTVRGCIS